MVAVGSSLRRPLRRRPSLGSSDDVPPQPPLLVIPPDDGTAIVPGTPNLTADQLRADFIVALAANRSDQVQTTLEQLGLFLQTVNTVGRAVFIGEYGNAVSDPIVSEQLYTLRSVYKTFGKPTWTARTDWIPQTAPNVVELRVDGGMDGETRGEHPAAGSWSVIPGNDPLGNANPFCWELLASAYKPNCVFTKGHMYVPGTQFDGAGPLNALNAEIADVSRPLGPGTLRLPSGCIWAQSATIRFPWAISVLGHGGYNTTMILADTGLQPPLDKDKFHTVVSCGEGAGGIKYANVSQVRWGRFRVLANRARQRFGKGGAAVALGGEADTGEPANGPYTAENANPVTVWIDDFGGSGAAGYFMTLGGHNAKQRLMFGRIEMSWSDSDLIDCKNRQSLNEIFFFDRMLMDWWAMGDQGTNLRHDVLLDPNGITTASGTSTVTIPLPLLGSFPTPGDIVTIRPGATSGNGINPVGSWPLISTFNNLATLDLSPQVASGDGGIGGSTPMMFNPQISPGDVIVDTRGIKWIVGVLSGTSMIYGRNGPRQRGGAGDGNAAGLGGVNVIFYFMDINDVSPSWVATTSGICRGMVTLLGDGATVHTMNLTSTGGAIGVHTGATADNTRIDNITTVGMSIPAKFEGDRAVIRWGRFIDTTFKNTEVFGAVLNTLINLDPDPASGATGTSVIIITCPGPHGQITGAKAAFIAFVNSNGMTLRPSNSPPPYAITVINPTQFSVVGAGTITNGAVAWGGPGASVRFDGANHTATDNEFHHLSFEYSQLGGGAGVIGLSIGTQPQIGGQDLLGQADGTVVHFVRDKGSQFPYVDYGTNTDYVVGNSGGIPNRPRLDVLNVPPLSSPSITRNLVYERTVDPALPVSTIDILALDPFDELQVEIEGIVHNSLTSQNWGLQVSTNNGDTWLVDAADYQRIGSTNAGKLIFTSGVNAAQPVSGLIQFTNFNLTAQRTEAWINAGLAGDATSAQNANGFVVVPARHNALRILPGLNQINGGTVRVYAKQGGDVGS